MFATIMTPRGNVDVDVGRDVSERITCNGAAKRVPGSIVCTGELASEGVRVIWYRR